MSEPAHWWERPQAFLYAWDFARHEARFLELNRSTLENSSFLDQRIAADMSRIRPAPMAEILGNQDGAGRMPRGFIFHTGFCASTLLARSLDRPGRTLSLREPLPLLQLADLARGFTQADYRYASILRCTLALMSRPFMDNEAVLVKPTNVANNLIGPLLDIHTETRGLVLYDDLEPFLLSILKRPSESEKGVRGFLRRLLHDLGARFDDLLPSDLAEAATLAWHLEIRQIQACLEGPFSGRLRVLHTQKLLSRPTDALSAVSDWLGLGFSRAECQSIARGQLWRSHAKAPGIAYDPVQRNREQAAIRRLAAKPLKSALAYAAAIRSRPIAEFRSCSLLETAETRRESW